MTIRTKLLMISTTGIAVVSLATIAASYYSIDQELGRKAADQLKSKRFALDTEISETRDMLATVAALAASHPGLIRMVADNDSGELGNMLRELLTTSGYHVATVSNAQGMVVARGHSRKQGDSVTPQRNVVKALQGVATSGFEKGTEAGFSLRAGHPVRDGNRIIGVLTLGFDFSKSGLVDRFKKAHDIEATLFQGDTRVATTVMSEGKRATGTKMQDQKVIEAVLNNGNVYQAETVILGNPYDAAYWPAKDADGKITGMVFVGMSREVQTSVTRHTLTMVAIVAVIVALAMAFFVSIVLAGICRRLGVLQQVADSVALGNCGRASDLLTTMDRS
jgi:methyl-accepting chemotaxis protein